MIGLGFAGLNASIYFIIFAIQENRRCFFLLT